MSAWISAGLWQWKNQGYQLAFPKLHRQIESSLGDQDQNLEENGVRLTLIATESPGATIHGSAYPMISGGYASCSLLEVMILGQSSANFKINIVDLDARE